MNIFCLLLGHTWIPETQSPEICWTATKGGHVLEQTAGDEPVRHYDVCRRCGERREAARRRHDADRPETIES